ncbi:hypothetical protein ACVWXO_004142 [Bradyrhizobium sp. LM2.7]
MAVTLRRPRYGVTVPLRRYACVTVKRYARYAVTVEA